jgi:hypothetical protein
MFYSLSEKPVCKASIPANINKLAQSIRPVSMDELLAGFRNPEL